MKPKTSPAQTDSAGIETHSIKVIKLKARDRVTLTGWRQPTVSRI
jgi:hypothetical protein